MAGVPDLMTLLSLDAKHSVSPFGGSHRAVLIKRDSTNSGDFAFNNFLNYFGRREQSLNVILICLSHDWTNYSAIAAKCGFNLRRTKNSGNIEVISVISEYLDFIRRDEQNFNPCKFIREQLDTLLNQHFSTSNDTSKTPVVLIDDLSILLTLGSKPHEAYQLVLWIDRLLRSKVIYREEPMHLSYLVIQSMSPNSKPSSSSHEDLDEMLNLLLSNLENSSDIVLTLKPLDTGHSTRVDGTIKIIDNRLTSGVSTGASRDKPLQSLLMGHSASVGTKQAFFYKVSDRRVRLTSSALIF